LREDKMQIPELTRFGYIEDLLLSDLLAMLFGAVVVILIMGGNYPLLLLVVGGEFFNLNSQYHQIKSAICYGRFQGLEMAKKEG